jgi:UDP-glucose 6-dehydrogenase
MCRPLNRFQFYISTVFILCNRNKVSASTETISDTAACWQPMSLREGFALYEFQVSQKHIIFGESLPVRSKFVVFQNVIEFSSEFNELTLIVDSRV